MLPEQLRCVFTGRLERRNGSYIVEIPEREVQNGNVAEDDLYRIGVVETDTSPTENDQGTDTPEQSERTTGKKSMQATEQNTSSKRAAGAYQGGADAQSETRGPPVEENETRVLTIEDMGDQGDGLARVEHGYIVFVPETSVGDEVRVEMETIKKNFAFAKVIERNPSQPNIEKDSPVAN